MPETRSAISYDQSEDSLRASFSALKFIEGTLVAYGDRSAKVINRKRSQLDHAHPLFVADDFEADDILLLQTKLSETDTQTFYVLFSEGPSADPEFYFIKTSTPDKIWASLPGTAISIPGNGSVYVSNRFNNTFTKRSKYTLTAKGLTEVKQPYFYVGLKTHTLSPLTLYTSPASTDVIAQLPKGSEVEVLLTDDRRDDKQHRTCFLIKTPFGLLGWAWIPESQYASSVIEGLGLWGD
ncbi:MAG TPA: hypothetical protein VIY48_20920 [Candidatus Paceibacterota bacterium]